MTTNKLQVKIDTPLNSFRLQVEFEFEGILALCGPSGSGKSSALQCIAGFRTIESGLVQFNGKTFFDSKNGVNISPRFRRIGVVFQDVALFPHMTVRENIAFGIEEKERTYVSEKVDQLIERFELKNIEKSFPKSISGGQAQRVAIARALAPDPELLLLDEPFNALDSELRKRIADRLLELQRSKDLTIILVSHAAEDVSNLTQNKMYISDGKLHQP